MQDELLYRGLRLHLGSRRAALGCALSLLLTSGCASPPPALESVYVCLDNHAPLHLALYDYPDGTHIAFHIGDNYHQTTRIWIADTAHQARRLERSRQRSRSMGVFGMYYSGGVERHGRVVVEYPQNQVPPALRDIVEKCAQL